MIRSALPLPDSSGDARYQTVFAFAIDHYRDETAIFERAAALGRPLSQKNTYVLLSEYAASEDCHVVGDAIRAWTVDRNGLMEIDLDEFAFHKAEKRIGRFYPYVSIEFHIHPDRKRVVIGTAMASTAGQGTVYLFNDSPNGTKLEPDPQAGFWIS